MTDRPAPKWQNCTKKRTIFTVFELHICCGLERFCCTANTKERTNGPPQFPTPELWGALGPPPVLPAETVLPAAATALPSGKKQTRQGRSPAGFADLKRSFRAHLVPCSGSAAGSPPSAGGSGSAGASGGVVISTLGSAAIYTVITVPTSTCAPAGSLADTTHPAA